MTKDELREQVAKLEATVDTLRTKAAAARKDARAAAARIADMQGQLAARPGSEKALAGAEPAKSPSKRARRSDKPAVSETQAPEGEIGEAASGEGAGAVIDENGR